MRARAPAPDLPRVTDNSPMATREGNERIPVVVQESYDDIARAVAHRIADLIRSRTAAGQGTVLGLATGSTPVGI